MREVFKVVQGYTNYEISNRGRVRNIQTAKFLSIFMNTYGWYYVGLMRDRRQHVVRVASLVADAFLKPPRDPHTSLLHRDGDRSNNAASNLVWRPRWFVVLYMRQMQDSTRYETEPFVSAKTGEVFESIAHFAMTAIVLPSLVYEAVYGADYISFPKYGELHRILH